MTEVSTTITLGKDWSVAGITDQWSQITNCLAELKALANSAGNRLFISLQDMECLDACGCQLLAVFVRDLKGIGIEPCLIQVPEPLVKTIDTLGFAHYFAIADWHSNEH